MSSAAKRRFGSVLLIAVIAGSAFLLSDVAVAKSDLSEPLSAGIVYPGFATAPAINPAGLAGVGATAAEGLFSPAVWGAASTGYGGAAAAGFGSFGLGASIASVSYPNAPAISSWTAAGAAQFEHLSIGASASSAFAGTGGTSPLSLSFGLIYGSGSGSGTSFGALVTGLNGTGPQVALGVGYAEKKKYNLELDLGLPPFAGIFASGSSYAVTAAAAVYAGIFGVSYFATGDVLLGASQGTSPLAISQGVSLLARPSKSLLLTLAFTGALGGLSGSAPTFGLTYLF